jgi:hypothetical protein
MQADVTGLTLVELRLFGGERGGGERCHWCGKPTESLAEGLEDAGRILNASRNGDLRLVWMHRG